MKYCGQHYNTLQSVCGTATIIQISKIVLDATARTKQGGGTSITFGPTPFGHEDDRIEWVGNPIHCGIGANQGERRIAVL